MPSRSIAPAADNDVTSAPIPGSWKLMPRMVTVVVPVTLPAEAFHHFPENGASEVHLATEFQNMTYERLPEGLREEMYAWVRANAADEKKPTDTDEQFLYRSRKKAIGPFKKPVWDLPEATRTEIGEALQAKFSFLFEKLRVPGTKAAVAKYVRPLDVAPAAPAAAGAFHRDDEAGD